jgi:hypothetical protein
VGHTSRSSGLLHLEVSRARVSQFASNCGGATIGSAFDIIVEVA